MTRIKLHKLMQMFKIRVCTVGLNNKSQKETISVTVPQLNRYYLIYQRMEIYEYIFNDESFKTYI